VLRRVDRDDWGLETRRFKLESPARTIDNLIEYKECDTPSSQLDLPPYLHRNDEPYRFQGLPIYV
jgi:hypothetical protein